MRTNTEQGTGKKTEVRTKTQQRAGKKTQMRTKTEQGTGKKTDENKQLKTQLDHCTNTATDN